MSVVESPIPLSQVSESMPTPQLEAGDCLTREEFERRYAGMPNCKKAELIQGLVYMPSPVRCDRHGEPHALLMTWLGIYMLSTPDVRAADNSTILLGPEDELQPDALLRRLPEAGGSSRVDSEGYLNGPPELVVEISASSASYDMHVKREVYRRSSVAEYLVWRVEDGEIDWFIHRDGAYQPIKPDVDGVLRSQAFPGLRLDPKALLAGDAAQLLAALHLGINSAEHSAFCNELMAHRTPPRV